MAYGDFKDLPRRTAADKIFHYKAFNNAKNPKYDGSQYRLASMIYKFIYKNIQIQAKKQELVLRTRNQLKNYTNQLSENLKNEK